MSSDDAWCTDITTEEDPPGTRGLFETIAHTFPLPPKGESWRTGQTATSAGSAMTGDFAIARTAIVVPTVNHSHVNTVAAEEE